MHKRKDDKLTKTSAARNGYTLIEALAVVAVIGLMISIVTISIGLSTRDLKIKKELESFIRVLNMAHTAASESDQRYVVVVNYEEGYYQLRELPSMPIDILTDPDLAAEFLYSETEPIIDENFSDDCWLDYVFFDDATDTRELDQTEIWLMAGRNGWANAAMMVFLDPDGNPYTVITSRLVGKAKLVEGEGYLIGPMAKEDVRF